MKVPEGYDVYWDAVVNIAFNIHQDLVDKFGEEAVTYQSVTTDLANDTDYFIEEELLKPDYDFILKAPGKWSACSKHTSAKITTLAKTEYNDVSVFANDVMYAAFFQDITDLVVAWAFSLQREINNSVVDND